MPGTVVTAVITSASASTHISELSLLVSPDLGGENLRPEL
jgi:hypothetical protein